MQGAIKFRNEPKAMPVISAGEGLYVIQANNTNEAITTGAETFQKLWIYPAKAAVAGVLTANAGTVYVGVSGAAAVPYLPDKRAATDTDYPAIIELPLGMRMRLADVRVRGTATDGVFYRYV